MSEFKKLSRLLDDSSEGGLKRLKTLEGFTVSVERMKERAYARVELEKVRGTLASYGVSPDMPDFEDHIPTMELKAAESAREFCRLQALATYGPGMATKVLDVCARFDTALTEIQRACEGMVETPVIVPVVDEGPNPHELFAQQVAEKEDMKERERARIADEEAQAEQAAKAEALAAEMEEQRFREQRDFEEARIESMSLVERLSTGYEALRRLPTSLFIQVLTSLERIILQAVDRPEIPKCIGLNNAAFLQDVGRVPGVIVFLRGVGYVHRCASDLSGLVQAAPNEPFLFLDEPDMVANFELWKHWELRLKSIASLLHSSLVQLAGRPTHLSDQLAAHAVPSLDWNLEQ